MDADIKSVADFCYNSGMEIINAMPEIASVVEDKIKNKIYQTVFSFPGIVYPAEKNVFNEMVSIVSEILREQYGYKIAANYSYSGVHPIEFMFEFNRSSIRRIDGLGLGDIYARIDHHDTVVRHANEMVRRATLIKLRYKTYNNQVWDGTDAVTDNEREFLGDIVKYLNDNSIPCTVSADSSFIIYQ